MDALLQDFRSACRSLWSRPGYFVVATVTLALGIGATTAVFSVVDALMLRPMFYADPSRVVNFAVHVNGRPANGVYSEGAWREYQQRTEVFEAVEAYTIANRVMTGGVEPLSISVLETSAGLLRLLGVAPQQGRLFSEEDARGATGPVVVLSDDLWREQFGADPDIVGKPIVFNDVPHIVIGIMPRGFVFPRVALRAWTLFSTPHAQRPSLELVARLQRSTSFEQASALVAALGPRMREIKGITQDRDAALERPTNINNSQRGPIYLVFAAVVLVLLIACVNVASMALAAGSGRARELSLRAALGASRRRLCRQLLIESGVVSVVGGAAGVWLALASVQAIAPLMPNELTFFNANEIRVDYRALIFAAIMSVVTVVLAGILPAFRGSHADVGEILKSGGRTATASRFERRTLSLLGVVQCAIAVLLLACAGLLIQSFVRLQAVDPGFDTRNLVVFSLSLPRQRYATAATQVALRENIARELSAAPGVLDVTIAGGFPPDGPAFAFDVDLETDVSSGVAASNLEVAYTPISPNYFSMMGIRLLAGRTFMETDGVDDVVISDTFATRYWGGPTQAVGGRFRLDNDKPWQTIVGVAGDVKQMGLDDRYGDLEFYHPWPRTAAGWGSHAIGIRTAQDPAALIPALKQRVWAVDPKLPIRESDEMRTVLAESIARPRFFFILMTVFAAIAALVAAVGIYGLFAYTVARRTSEIGIRLALGATTSQIGGLIMRQAVIIAVVGAGIGLAGAWSTSHAITSLLFQTTPTDPGALLGGAACLVVLALAACYVPARRARRVDPLELLKVE